MPLETGKSKEAFSKNVATEVNAGKPKEQAVAIAYAKQRGDSSSLAALDPVKLDACAAKADALLKRMDSLDGKFQHHKGKDNVRPDAEDEYVMNPIRIGSKVSYKGQTGIVEGPLRYKKSEPFLFVNLDISHKQITDDPKKFKLA